MEGIELTLECEVDDYVKEYVIYHNFYTENHMTIYDEIEFMFADDRDVKGTFLQSSNAIMQKGYVNFEYEGKTYNNVFCQFKFDRFLDKKYSEMWNDKFYHNFRRVAKEDKQYFVLPMKIYDVMGFESANLEKFKINEITVVKRSSTTSSGDRGRADDLCGGSKMNTQRTLFSELRFNVTNRNKTKL